MSSFSRWLAAVGVVLLTASGAFACPFCQSPAGQQVQAGTFNDAFFTNLLLLLPFPILLAVAALIHFGVPYAGPTPTDSPGRRGWR